MMNEPELKAHQGAPLFFFFFFFMTITFPAGSGGGKKKKRRRFVFNNLMIIIDTAAGADRVRVARPLIEVSRAVVAYAARAPLRFRYR